MKIGNSVSQILTTRDITEAPKQSDKLPETLAPAPDLKVAVDPKEQAAKSEAAKVTSAAQESLIRAELEQKYTKPRTTSDTTDSGGTQTPNESQIKEAEERLGNPLEMFDTKQNEGAQDSRSKQENSKADVINRLKEFGSVYGDGTPGSAQSGVGGSGGDGPGSTSGGGGKQDGGSGVRTGSNMTPEQRAAFEEMAGFNQGPESAKSKADGVESKVPDNGFGRRDAAVNSAIDNANPFNRMQDPTAQSDSDPRSQGEIGKKYGGKSMIGDGADDKKETDAGKGLGGALKIFDAFTGGAASTAYEGAKELNEATDGVFGQVVTSLPIIGLPLHTQNKVQEGLEAAGKLYDDAQTAAQLEAQKKATEKAIEEQKKKAAEEEAKKKAEEEKKKSGTDFDQETYNQRTRQKIDGATGFDFTSNLPKAPKTSGDVDPADEGYELGGQLNTAIAKQGKTGLIGQPVDNQDRDVGAGGNLSMGGDVDFEDKAGWAGREITEQPGDVDLPGDDPELPPAANQQDEETSTKQSNNALWAQLTYNLQKANQMKR